MPVDAPAENDALTGLPLREACEQAFADRIKRSRKAGASVSLVIMDLDLFGKLNQEQGRDAGDALLCRVAGLLTERAPADATLYRFGGDAFAWLATGLEKEQAFLEVEQLRRELEAETGALTISAGLAAFPDDGDKGPDVVNKAGEALYRAKVTGRNKVCLAREEKMVTKTSHYMQGQLMGLRRLAEREGIGEAVLLREALNDLLRKYNA
jgi:diguanylate cyclase (GGDEF)-like protein